MASPNEAQLFLADAAALDQLGKVHCLGVGWSTTGSPTGPHAVVALIKVPWDRANTKQKMILELRNADGQPVTIDVGQGPQIVVRFEGDVELGRPPGLAPGTMLDAPFALPVGPLPLQPGRYEYHLQLGDDEFSTFFQVRAPQIMGFTGQHAAG